MCARECIAQKSNWQNCILRKLLKRVDHSYVKITCSMMNSSEECSSCIRGGTAPVSMTARVCSEDPEAMFVKTQADSNCNQ